MWNDFPNVPSYWKTQQKDAQAGALDSVQALSDMIADCAVICKGRRCKGITNDHLKDQHIITVQAEEGNGDA